VSESLFFFVKKCVKSFFDELTVSVTYSAYGEINLYVFDKVNILKVCRFLKDYEDLTFCQLIDICGVDYLYYKLDDFLIESKGKDSSFFLTRFTTGRIENSFPYERFSVVYHLLSLKLNCRVRVYTFVSNFNPNLHSVNSVWSVADWYEREVFDLFGIEFLGHKNLCRILTDYGFRHFPLRKDFVVVGSSVLFYDNTVSKMSYGKSNVKLRRLIPKVIRLGRSCL
jgi:NADH-quinone oxidoreductase subunit C